jgi:hypothetical protein
VFTGGDDGAAPVAGLVRPKRGNLYGTAAGGGSGRVGVVFRFRRNGGRWVQAILHDFTIDKGGRNPWGPVALDPAGNLYGTAHAAAGDKFGGLVFVLKAGNQGKWLFTVLHNFAGAPDGAYPISALTMDSVGNIYSTTQAGGTGQACQGGCGTVFEVSP